MATNLGIDESLLNEAYQMSGLKSKKATVNEALAEYVRHRKQLEIIKVFGKIEMDQDYDYKKGRHR